MNSGKASGARYHSRLSRRLLLRFVLALVGWLVGFTGLCLLAMMACNTIIWQPWDPVYQFLQFVKEPVILGIGYQRGILIVVGMTVFIELFYKILNSFD